MSCARALALAASLVAVVVGQLTSSSAAAQNVVVVPADNSYAVYGGEAGVQPRYAGLAPFIEALSPHGTWIDLPSVGLVWKPDDSRVGVTFVPYVTNGHWAYSEVGWVFESDFEWGYATFHYGRWLFDGQWGWVWAPDSEWGASWVDWRVADGYVGWSPLPPIGYSYAAGYGPSYTFVSLTYLTYVDLGTYILPAPATTYWTERSAPCTTVWSGAGQTWPAGPQIAVPPRGVVRVNPPPRGVVQVRPPARAATGAASSDRVAARAGGFVDASARVGVSGPRVPPGAPAWGTTRPAPPSAPPSAPPPRFGVQRTVLPPRYDVPPPPSTPPVYAQPAAPPPVYAQPAQPQRPAFAQPPVYAQPAQPQRPAFAQPPVYAQPAQPQRPAFAQPAQPQQPSFAQPQRPAFVQPPPAQPQRPTFAQPVEPQRPAFAQPARPAFVQQQATVVRPPPPQAPVVARPPPQVVVPPSAVRGGMGVRR